MATGGGGIRSGPGTGTDGPGLTLDGQRMMGGLGEEVLPPAYTQNMERVLVPALAASGFWPGFRPVRVLSRSLSDSRYTQFIEPRSSRSSVPLHAGYSLPDEGIPKQFPFFDQPGVEAYKKNMFRLLGQWK